MKKRNLLFLILLTVMIIPTFVFAKEEVFYTNDNGVSLTEKEYNFISEMFYEGYQELLTQEMYDEIKLNDTFSQPIEKKCVKIVPKATRGTYIEDTVRILSIAKSTTDIDCLINTLLEWKAEPTNKGYDVIGAYFENTKLVNSPFTVVASSVEQKVCLDYKNASNGLGCSFMVVAGNDTKITQTYRVAKGGHVYASYQHAGKPAFLSESKDYEFSYYGYGNVFKFSDKVREIYDAMEGVDIAV